MSTFGRLDIVAMLLVSASLVNVRGDEKKPVPVVPNYFPLQAGNEWQYEGNLNGKEGKITMRIAKIETIDRRKLARLEGVVEGEIVTTEHLQQTEKGIQRHRFNGAEITPPLMVLKYPAKDGDKWSGEVSSGDQKIKYSSEATEEQIEVPAGKFKTIRVILKAEEKGQVINTTYWFAKDVGIVKQTMNVGDFNALLELKSHKRGK